MEYLGESLLAVQILLADRYSNSIHDLVIFCLALACVFLISHWKRNQRAKHDRQAIPLVIGGWGSRGKSGTERLKAALVNAMGRSVISKTSGCEPVILYGSRWGDLEEIPIHRPSGKATIWEQTDVLGLASRKKVDVFLWECMGLEPDYVRIMQRDWMRDDISTITNTYPDHEDIQGPTGLDVAKSIASFISKASTVISSETLMNAVLEEQSHIQQTKLISVDSDLQYLVTDDIMNRFPYTEHPNNVALILQLALKLGLDRDFALREMADRVCPDIGVLKTYPKAELNGIKMEFSNGFSANERFAALSNWQRLGFNHNTIIDDPEVWISVMVNNREDRVPRSKVFAELIVDELELDEIYLVGTNLDGFRRYYNRATSDFLNSLDLRSMESLRIASAELRRKLRVPSSNYELMMRLLAGTRIAHPDSMLQHFAKLLEVARRNQDDPSFYREWGLDQARQIMVRSFLKWESLTHDLKTSQSSDLTEKSRKLIELAREEFERKLITVPRLTQAKPGRLLEFISKRTPQNYLHRMHGIQNIKGIGLRWLEMWEDYAKEGKMPTCDGTESPVRTNRGSSYIARRWRAFYTPLREFQRTQLIRRAYRFFEQDHLEARELRKVIRTSDIG